MIFSLVSYRLFEYRHFAYRLIAKGAKYQQNISFLTDQLFDWHTRLFVIWAFCISAFLFIGLFLVTVFRYPRACRYRVSIYSSYFFIRIMNIFDLLFEYSNNIRIFILLNTTPCLIHYRWNNGFLVLWLRVFSRI
jgi:hypothetical protein